MAAGIPTYSGRCVVEVVSKELIMNHTRFHYLLIYLGAFGVVTRVWIKAYPPLAAVNTVAGAVTCQDLDAYGRLISNVVDNSVALRDVGHYVSRP